MCEGVPSGPGSSGATELAAGTPVNRHKLWGTESSGQPLSQQEASLPVCPKHKSTYTSTSTSYPVPGCKQEGQRPQLVLLMRSKDSSA